MVLLVFCSKNQQNHTKTNGLTGILISQDSWGCPGSAGSTRAAPRVLRDQKTSQTICFCMVLNKIPGKPFVYKAKS